MCKVSALGNPVSNTWNAAVIHTALSDVINYATVASVLGETEKRKARSGFKVATHFFPIVKLYAIFKGMVDQKPLKIDLHYF